MKKLQLLILLFLLSGCGIEKDITTIVKQEGNTIIAMNYPNTKEPLLNEHIKKYIDKNYEEFQKEYENVKLKDSAEFNIDYTYHTNGKFILVTIRKFINSSILAHPINEIKTFVFDTEKKQFLSLKDIIKEEQIPLFLTKLKQALKEKYKDCLLENFEKNLEEDTTFYESFSFDEKNIHIFFNPYLITSGYCNILEILIPINNFSLKIPIESEQTEQKEKTEYTFQQNNIDFKKPVIALTFDDGPSKYTNKILDILKENNANATFFVIGNKVEIFKDTIQKMVSLGNEIGNHSYSHKWLTKLNKEEFQTEIEKTQNIVKEITGYTPLLLRPTYGSINKQIRLNTDLKIVMWTVDTMDWKLKNSKTIAERALKDIKDGDIILMHDIRERTLEAIKILIPELKKQGYQFVTVSELEEVKLLRKQNS